MRLVSSKPNHRYSNLSIPLYQKALSLAKPALDPRPETRHRYESGNIAHQIAPTRVEYQPIDELLVQRWAGQETNQDE